MRTFRILTVFWMSRLLGVPVYVDQAFFVKGINSKRSLSSR